MPDRKAIAVHVGGAHEEFTFGTGSFDGLNALQSKIGGYVQAMISQDRQFTVWFDEEGGPEIKALDVNPLGTALYYQFCPIMRQTGRPMFGTVVITGGPDNADDTLGLSDEQASAIMAALDKATQ